MKHLRLLLVVLAFSIPVSLRSGAIGQGLTTCPSSGAKQLSSTTTKTTWINIQAPSDNAGAVYVGGPAIVGTSATCNASGSKGACILSTGNVFMPAISNTSSYDLAQIWFACTTSSDSVRYLYSQ